MKDRLFNTFLEVANILRYISPFFKPVKKNLPFCKFLFSCTFLINKIYCVALKKPSDVPHLSFLKMTLT